MFVPGSNPPPPGFSLDRRELAKAQGRRKHLGRAERRLVVFLPVSLVLLTVLIQMFVAIARTPPGADVPPIIAPLPIPPRADLATAADLPTAAAVAHERPFIAEAIRNRSTIRLSDGIDGATLAWAETLLADDQRTPSIPQRADGVALEQGLALGSPVLVTGRLTDARIDALTNSPDNGAERWARLLLTLDDGRQVAGLRPLSTATTAGDPLPTIGQEVAVIGRFLGPVELPALAPSAGSSTASSVRIPLLAIRVLRLQDRTTTDPSNDWMADLRASPPEELPAGTFAEVNDERPVLESRPYYLLLGQTLLDAGKGLPPAPVGNTRGSAIHQDPPAFRGQRFTVTAWVHQVWEDDLVRQDQPFAIGRVWRVLAWNRDLDPVEELQDGRTVVRNNPLRLYEFCLSGLDAPPAKGSRIAVTGRFFKFRAIPVPKDRARDRALGLQRQSDHVYPFVFVGHGLTYLPLVEERRWGWADAAALVLAAALGLVIAVVARSDRAKESTLGEVVRRIRTMRSAKSSNRRSARSAKSE